ncbi:uroporphyrinogen decarboxylase [Acidaminobacter sp. JC074]|uniref:uroporphyrinogen decarboxylase family protein n=1 Tax=Acidaminobacter sp. JC074 TaxID=2530199 RepID=UPI001F0F70CF|nr:uroporphyrinogen decarboxylase family protein [Acidaminobacter sp. JC074]MCH4887552.1 uroporphyrinogen decarboxylase [Acidaminobacter sp. JC074]
MNGRERIINTLKHQAVDQLPWVPFAGIHAGALKGYTARELLTDKDKLIESLLEVKKIYRPDGMPVMFDLQIEAEILGCELVWAEDAPPSVKTHPLELSKEVPCKCLMPSKNDGRLPLVLDAMTALRKLVDDVALYGLVCGPFTLASHLRGSMIFMDMFDDEQYVKDLLDYANEVCKKIADYYIEAGMDVIAVVDPLVSQISPDHFKQFMHEPFESLFTHIRNKNVLSSFFVCGNATPNIEVMCLTKPDSISIDENVDMMTAKAITDKHHVAIGGNIPLTTVMLLGNQQDNMKCTIDLMDSVSHDNLIIAPGCDMPYATPIENTIAVQQAIRQPEEVRKMIENYEAVDDDIEVELPDYKNLERPLVEVFTLDSETCAACTYMMAAANVAKETFGEDIEVIEYKYTIRENIARCKKMEVPNLPSMYINGQLKFKSIIPSKTELEESIKVHL